MAGRGDVVLSDLRRAEAHLRIPADPGALYLLKGPRAMSVEVSAGTAELRLAVPAGRYEIERRARNGRARGEVGLSRGEDRIALGSGGSNRLRTAILQVLVGLVEQAQEPAT